MPKGIYKVPVAVNEPIKSYAPGSPERKELQAMLKELRGQKINIPMYIGGKEVESNVIVRLHPPHDHQHVPPRRWQHLDGHGGWLAPPGSEDRCVDRSSA